MFYFQETHELELAPDSNPVVQSDTNTYSKKVDYESSIEEMVSNTTFSKNANSWRSLDSVSKGMNHDSKDNRGEVNILSELETEQKLHTFGISKPKTSEYYETGESEDIERNRTHAILSNGWQDVVTPELTSSSLVSQF